MLQSSQTLTNASNASTYSNLQEMLNLQPELRLSCCNRMHEANPAGQENRGTHMRVLYCFFSRPIYAVIILESEVDEAEKGY